MAIDTWELAGLPWGPTCDAELARLKVVVAKPRRFTELCLRRPSGGGGRLYACSTYQYKRAWPWSLVDGDRVPLLVISALETDDHRQRLVIHEAMHWLGGCSGKGIDHDHVDDFVWRGVMRVAQHRLAQGGHGGRFAELSASLVRRARQ
jgi:hypothetical protein